MKEGFCLKKQPTFEAFVKAHFAIDDLAKGEELLRKCDYDFYQILRDEYDGHDVSFHLAKLLDERQKWLKKGDVYEMYTHGYPLLRAMYDSLFRYEPDVYDQVGPNEPWERGD